ncbi:PTS sugar transporter subunit IIA [Anaerorhabdus sp.]|uniref:PTS sugar transporter subunit IIA n=1 Tax=Anaerorhabdus sp. TaxID=1872524 RepID=UPI002FCB1C3C
MNIKDVLDDRIILNNLHAENKDDALTQMSIKLMEAGYIEDVESFKKDIYLRESEGITGIGNYVAIPHGKSDSVTHVGISIAKLDQEIEWETLDGKGVKIIFLFAVSNNNEYAMNHMRLLAQIAGKLGIDENIEALLKASNKEDIKRVFS